MMKDSLNASRPISSAVQSSEQIEEMFDALSYIKVTSEEASKITLSLVFCIYLFSKIIIFWEITH